MKILFAGGGTAGHINPALAVANYIKEREKDTEIRFVGTKEGLESTLVPHSGYDIDIIKIHGFNRKLSFGTIKTMLEIPGAVLASKRIIKNFKPDIVVGTGGYVCGPVLYAAAKMGISTLVHESNAYAGITTRILARYVDVVAVGIEAAKERISDAKKVIFTGNPVRPSILSADSFSSRRKMGLDQRPFIVVFGGSLGARDFNKAVVDWISSVADTGEYQILMGTGKNNQYESVLKRFRQNGTNIEENESITVSEYIYDMDIAMNAADLVVSRAGASTLAELTAIGKPAVLVPSPYVADNHQEHNARAVEKGGGAVVITEAELSSKTLNAVIEEVTKNSEILAEMKKGSAAMGVPDAVERIYRQMLQMI